MLIFTYDFIPLMSANTLLFDEKSILSVILRMGILIWLFKLPTLHLILFDILACYVECKNNLYLNSCRILPKVVP